MGAASEALVLIRRLRGIRGTDAERYDALVQVDGPGVLAGRNLPPLCSPP
jgi:hypothetical protein